MSFAHRTAVAVMAAIPLLAKAQAADPANPAAIVAAPLYDSAFTAYQPFTAASEAPEQGWRAANDQMSRLRGHAGHITEAGAPDAHSSSTSSPAKETPKSPAPPSGHGMHHRHGGK